MSYAAELGRSYLLRLLTSGDLKLRNRAQAGALPRPLAAGFDAALRGPLVVTSGLARGLYVDGRHLPVSHVHAYGISRGILEPSVQEALRRTVRPGAVVWDVGANVGFFALLAMRLAGEGGRVVAFDPLPEHAAAIRANAALNGMDALRTREVAVAAAAGRAEFLRVRETSQSHLRDRGWHRDTEDVVEVEVVALDDEPGPPPDVVKIDVEGSEVAVLDGAQRLLTEHRPALIVELHATNAEVAERLVAHGYAFTNLDGPEPVLDAGPVRLLALPR